MLVARGEEPGIGLLELSANGRAVAVSPDNSIKASSPATVDFTFGPVGDDVPNRTSMRIRFKLEGYDPEWREAVTEPNTSVKMRLFVSFLDPNLNEVRRLDFLANGQSPGWTGSFKTSTLQHRRETIQVPPEASTFVVGISSAGGPEAMGVYAVSDFVARLQGATNGPAEEPLVAFFGNGREPDDLLAASQGWMRSGLRPVMASIVKVGAGRQTRALAVVDDDPRGHAQWNTSKNHGPQVQPGDQLVLEWDEMFSVGQATPATVSYHNLTPGYYRFSLNKLTLLGQPTDVEYSVGLEVPLPFWSTPWFWSTVAILIIGLLVGGLRFRALQHLRMENARLEQQQVLERERFRIARDIHDDLGARVTQISLASAMAERTASEASSRTNFQDITRMAREMVTSLYDTLWVVNPENDNLEALGNYLCQMVNQLCSQAGLKCRLEVPPLPNDVAISSHQRHNLSMAVKEALHNVIKHAAASQVQMKIELHDCRLSLAIQDDGHGFDLESVSPGNGLTNMKHRLEDMGGGVEVKSEAGCGTRVHLKMPVQPRVTPDQKTRAAGRSPK